MAIERLTDEASEIAERLTVAARSWMRTDATEHRDPATEVELLLETMNELNARRLRIAELEAALTLIAAGEIDEGGCVRNRPDARVIAHDALWPNG